LPGERAPDIAARLGEIAREEPPMTLGVTGLRLLGRGVAYALESEALQRLRGGLARDWSDALTAQDRQPSARMSRSRTRRRPTTPVRCTRR
jgi:hypothetical protein